MLHQPKIVNPGAARVGAPKERIDLEGHGAKWVRYEHEYRYRFAAQYIQDAVVCECACGSGFGTKLLAEAGARQIYAFDIAYSAASAAQAACAGAQVVVGVASSYDLPLNDSSIDVYISLETIEHVTQPEKILSEAIRVLKPSGIFLCSTPNRSITNAGHPLQHPPLNPFHVFEYNQAEFTEALSRYFGQVEMFGLNYEPRWKTDLLAGIGSVTPGVVAARLNQATKLPRLIAHDPEHHRVEPVSMHPQATPEYLFGMCMLPKKP